MTFNTVPPLTFFNRQIFSKAETQSLYNPTFFPVTEIETRARQILLEDYSGNEYLQTLFPKIQSALNTLDLYRETGFTLVTPESMLSHLEAICDMF